MASTAGPRRRRPRTGRAARQGSGVRLQQYLQLQQPFEGAVDPFVGQREPVAHLIGQGQVLAEGKATRKDRAGAVELVVVDTEVVVALQLDARLELGIQAIQTEPGVTSEPSGRSSKPPLLDPVFLLPPTDKLENIGNLLVGYIRNGRHIPEVPVMLFDAELRRAVKGIIPMVVGFIKRVNQRRSGVGDTFSPFSMTGRTFLPEGHQSSTIGKRHLGRFDQIGNRAGSGRPMVHARCETRAGARQKKQ